MKHATPDTVVSLVPLLNRIRAIPGLVEKKPGVYHRKSKVFLHFHEDGDHIYADVKLIPPDFSRLPVTTQKEQNALFKAIKGSFKET